MVGQRVLTNSFDPNIFIYLLLLFLLATYRGMSCMLKLIFSNDKNIHEEVSGALNDSDKSSLWEQKGK